jgi:hypothetical protein
MVANGGGDVAQERIRITVAFVDPIPGHGKIGVSGEVCQQRGLPETCWRTNQLKGIRQILV